LIVQYLGELDSLSIRIRKQLNNNVIYYRWDGWEQGLYV